MLFFRDTNENEEIVTLTLSHKSQDTQVQTVIRGTEKWMKLITDPVKKPIIETAKMAMEQIRMLELEGKKKNHFNSFELGIQFYLFRFNWIFDFKVD